MNVSTVAAAATATRAIYFAKWSTSELVHRMAMNELEGTPDARIAQMWCALSVKVGGMVAAANAVWAEKCAIIAERSIQMAAA